MHTQISRYHATASKDVLARLALQRASIMHLVDRIADRPSHRSTDLPPMQTIC
jgi:hypothetical protein